MVGHPYGCQQEGILLSHDSVNSEQSAHRGDDRALTTKQTARSIEIPQALPMRLHVLDIARHVVIAPNGKRYVVATYDDSRLGHGYVTAVYLQQNGYLTLIRLTVSESSSATAEEAVQHHIAVAQAIQRGEMNEFNK